MPKRDCAKLTSLRQAVVAAAVSALLCLPAPGAASAGQALGSGEAAAAGQPGDTRAGDTRADYTRAQIELFGTPHLDNVRAPTTLHYDFRRRGAEAEPRDDRIDVVVTEILPDGRKNLSFRYLSGAEERRFAPLQGFRGNPLIMLFLQRDVERLSEATGGSELYFRNRIRESFAGAAEVAEVTLPDGGAPARLVTVEPFVDDPMIDRFPRYRHKRYEFLLSTAVPGGVERLSAVLPAEGGGAPAVEETVTFEEAEP